MSKIYILLLATTLIIGCSKENEPIKHTKSKSFDYIENIVVTNDEEKISYRVGEEIITFTPNDLPITSIMVESSAAVAYLNELEALSLVKGVTDPNYIYNAEIRNKITLQEILEIGASNELYTELILKHRPQLIIANTNPVLAKYHQQLKDNGIKILYLDEYKEKTPLAQAEYLKVIGKLIGKEEVAHQKFETIKNSYLETKALIQEKGNSNVSTFLNTMMGDVWYIPNKESIQVQLIEDAKGNYIFGKKGDDLVTNSSFEEVYTKAKDATHWLNVINYSSLVQMSNDRKEYSWFKAYKTGHVYNYSKRKNKNGALDIYESGIVRPDILLKDLGKIFHPELFPSHELYYYEQLK